MAETIDLLTAARRLTAAEGVLLLTHRRPDGDTVGSAAALCRGLRRLGKAAWVFPNEDLTPRLAFLLEDLLAPPAAQYDLVAAVDLADIPLLTTSAAQFAKKVDLCLDHHPSNTGYAAELLLYPKAAATGEVIYQLLRLLGVSFDLKIWEALYIAVATDTGCFRFSNTTPLSHRIAAEALEAGLDFHPHNRTFFEKKSKTRFLIEKRMLDAMTFSSDGRIAAAWIERDWLKEIGATDDDLDNLSTLTMTIDGVDCGIILTQEKTSSDYKVSVRTHMPADASRVCREFGGGGHPRAAGCTVSGPGKQAMEKLMAAAQGELARC